MIEERQLSNLSSLVPEEWRAQFKSAIFHFFPCGIPLHSSEAQTLMSLWPLARRISDHPVGFTLLRIDDATFHSVTTQIRYADGQREVITTFGDRKIPGGTYLLIYSPVLATPEGGTNEGLASKAISASRGLITAALGHSAAEASIYSVESHLAEEKTSYSSATIENFIPPDQYCFLKVEVINALDKAAATHFPADLKQRVETAFLFLGASAAVIDPIMRFTNAWIALEVICRSREEARRAIEAVARDVGIYTRLKVGRDDLFHKGKSFAMSPDDERVIHAAIFHVLLQYYRLKK